MSTAATIRLLTSIKLRCGELSVTTYNVEAGSMIIFTPNNPKPADTPIVTRNLNARMFSVIAFSIDKVSQAVLLGLLHKYHHIIFAKSSYANVF